ncbi:MAG TPA: BamA/TamA family outer membrane protein [Bacteroidales bacterium]|nr:BamA/TamA family outer membrane protein [Bacteroidales bacterium]HSA43730.1 BamA/TamA family outer membrane protein [Bacteroidales bacterium]
MRWCIFRLLMPVLALWLSSCSVTDRLAEGDYLLRRNSLDIHPHQQGLSDLQAYIKQKPNKRMLGVFPLEIWADQFATRGKQHWFRRWIGRAVAARPVILDTSLSKQSVTNMKAYLANTGYYQARVNVTHRFRRKHATAQYHVYPGSQYKLRNVTYEISDTVISALLSKDVRNSLIGSGKAYNVYVLDNERDRITMLLRDQGYYYFIKDYITFLADSSAGGQQIDLSLRIADPVVAESDSLRPPPREHQPCTLRNITIEPDYDPLRMDGNGNDTLLFATGNRSGSGNSDYYRFVFRDRIPVRPSVITQNLDLSPGHLFRISDVEQSYTRLNELPFYRFINLEFTPVSDSNRNGQVRYLDGHIQMTRNKLMAVSVETEGTNTGGDFGVAASLVMENRNLFRGAELLNIQMKGALEIQKRVGEQYEADKAFFNTFETGIQAGLVFPKFLVPVNQERFSRAFRPKTRINTGLNYQERSSFRRYRTEVSFGYEWKESQFKRHILNPLEINSVRIFPDSTFTANLLAFNDQRLTDQYTDHLIMALRYSYVYNNQQLNKREDFFYFKSNLESAGNLLSGINQLTHAKKDDNGQYALFGIRYAQYLKLDGDFRYYNLLGTGTVVYRAALGIGYAYGNSSALPFDRGFYAGGANGMRGWAIRSLGPGAYFDAESGLQFEKTGDMLIESNLEWRFPVLGWFHGALFTDAGNIWLLKPSDQLPGGTFRGDVFFRQIAIDAGLGFRLDFSFFIFRLDGALQIRNPGSGVERTWIDAGRIRMRDVMWNFGIGYPF